MTLIQLFTAIANAIRAKTGSSETIKAENFPIEIADITTGNLSDEEYAEANNDLDDILEGSTPAKIYPPDWSEIGYEDTPQSIIDGFNYAKEIQENWDSSVTSLYNKFKKDLRLKFMPLVDTSNATNTYTMFGECTSLETIPLLDTSNVTNMSYMFVSCTSLKTIPLLNTNKVTDMSNMFASCTSLIAIPQLNTSNNNTIQGMFNGCTSLKTIPLLNTNKVTNMNGMFLSCTSLETIPLLDTSNVTNMGYMFYNCKQLTTIPVLNTSKVTNINNIFGSCSRLSNESLNNILAMCIGATSYTGTKTLKYIGLSSSQATTCTTLSNWQACVDAGWTTGY